MRSAEASPSRPGAAEAGTRPIRYGREYLVVLVAVGLLYGLTVAPGPLWQDNGLAQVRVLRHDLHGHLGLALSHPLYYLLAIAFQALPLHESALKTNLVSAVFGAVTVANVFLLLRLITRRRIAAALGAISLAVAHTFWQQSVMAEVYSVSTALIVAELLCLVRYIQTGARYWLPVMLLANGLGVSNHLLSALDLPVWVVLLGWLLWRRRIGPGALLAAGGAWLAGAAIYLALVVGEIAGGQPVKDVLRSALFGGTFARNVLNTQLSLHLLANSVLYLGLNFPTPIALLAAVGLAALRRFEPRPVAVVLAVLLAIHLAWAVHYDVPDQYTFFVVAVVLISIVIGIGANRFLRSRRPAWAWIAIMGALLPPVVYAPLPWIVRASGSGLGLMRELPFRDDYKYFLWPWKLGDDAALRFAQEVQHWVPDGAVLIADDTTVRPIHYLMETGRWEGRFSVWPPLQEDPAVLWPTEEQIAGPLRAGLVYIVTPRRGYCPLWLVREYTFEPVGMLYRVVGPRPTTT